MAIHWTRSILSPRRYEHFWQDCAVPLAYLMRDGSLWDYGVAATMTVNVLLYVPAKALAGMVVLNVGVS